MHLLSSEHRLIFRDDPNHARKISAQEMQSIQDAETKAKRLKEKLDKLGGLGEELGKEVTEAMKDKNKIDRSKLSDVERKMLELEDKEREAKDKLESDLNKYKSNGTFSEQICKKWRERYEKGTPGQRIEFMQTKWPQYVNDSERGFEKGSKLIGEMNVKKDSFGKLYGERALRPVIRPLTEKRYEESWADRISTAKKTDSELEKFQTERKSLEGKKKKALAQLAKDEKMEQADISKWDDWSNKQGFTNAELDKFISTLPTLVTRFSGKDTEQYDQMQTEIQQHQSLGMPSKEAAMTKKEFLKLDAGKRQAWVRQTKMEIAARESLFAGFEAELTQLASQKIMPPRHIAQWTQWLQNKCKNDPQWTNDFMRSYDLGGKIMEHTGNDAKEYKEFYDKKDPKKIDQFLNMEHSQRAAEMQKMRELKRLSMAEEGLDAAVGADIDPKTLLYIEAAFRDNPDLANMLKRMVGQPPSVQKNFFIMVTNTIRKEDEEGTDKKDDGSATEIAKARDEKASEEVKTEEAQSDAEAGKKETTEKEGEEEMEWSYEVIAAGNLSLKDLQRLKKGDPNFQVLGVVGDEEENQEKAEAEDDKKTEASALEQEKEEVKILDEQSAEKIANQQEEGEEEAAKTDQKTTKPQFEPYIDARAEQRRMQEMRTQQLTKAETPAAETGLKEDEQLPDSEQEDQAEASGAQQGQGAGLAATRGGEQEQLVKDSEVAAAQADSERARQEGYRIDTEQMGEAADDRVRTEQVPQPVRQEQTFERQQTEAQTVQRQPTAGQLDEEDRHRRELEAEEARQQAARETVAAKPNEQVKGRVDGQTSETRERITSVKKTEPEAEAKKDKQKTINADEIMEMDENQKLRVRKKVPKKAKAEVASEGVAGSKPVTVEKYPDGTTNVNIKVGRTESEQKDAMREFAKVDKPDQKTYLNVKTNQGKLTSRELREMRNLGKNLGMAA